MNFMRILTLSRPRFWLYELGTFAIGVLAGMASVGMGFGDIAEGSSLSLVVLVYGLYFLIPANILIYGINDVFDYETDMKNPKKTEYEDVLDPKYHRTVFWWIGFTTLPFVIYGVFALSLSALIALVAFVFFAMFYSTPPIRAKARPGLDSFFSGAHYTVTAVFGYLLINPDPATINWLLVLAGLLWTVAMHAYSAVPDIQADSDADLKTIATKLGARKTLHLCMSLYVISFGLLALYTTPLFLLLALPYVYLVARSYATDDQKLFALYTYFPYLNSLVGAVITIYLLVLVGG